MSKSLMRATPHVITRDDPLWLDVAQPWQRNTWTPPASLPIEPLEFTSEQATRVPSVGADVHVPFLQAVGTAIFIGVISGSLAIWLGWGWQIPVMLAAISAALMWFSAVADTRALLRRIETFVGKDLDRDGHIGKQHTTSINVRVAETGRSPKDLFLQFEDVRPEQLSQLFVGALRGESLGESRWSGDGKPFSRKTYRAVRDGLVEADLLTWKDNEHRKQGLTLTRSGRPVLEKWIEHYEGQGVRT